MIFNIFIILFYLLVNINSVEATDINENNIIAKDKIMMYDAETGETTEVIFDKKKLNKLNTTRTVDGGNIIIESGNKNRKDRFFMANNTLSATDSPVTNTNEFPYKAICQLQYGEGGQAKGSGTGALVGYRILLTAAHCVFDENNNDEKFPNWIAYAGRRGGESTAYDKSGWSKVYYSTGWTSTHKQEYDWAVCVLNERMENAGASHMGVIYYDDYNTMKNLEINCVGYPATHGGYYPYKTTGIITNTWEKFFKGSNYSESGYSGSPIYINGGYIVGVTHGYYSNNELCGVRIYEDFNNTILEAYNEYE